MGDDNGTVNRISVASSQCCLCLVVGWLLLRVGAWLLSLPIQDDGMRDRLGEGGIEHTYSPSDPDQHGVPS